MADIKVNGNTYNGITHIQVAKAGGGGYQKFIEGEGQWTTEGIATGAEPSGDIVLTGNVVREFAFAGKPITSFEAAELTSVGNSAFESCSKLETFKCRSMNPTANFVFRDCKSLKNVDIIPISPGKLYGQSFFYNCTALEEVTLYGDTSQAMFTGCTALKKIDMRAGNLSGYTCFSGATALTTLILRQSSVITMHGVNVFNNTPFASGGTGGTIYVPAALIDSYKAAMNWSTLDGYGTITWKAIEGSEYDESV